MDFWNEEKNMGGLSGKEGNRVKPKRLRDIYSEGVLYAASSTYPNGLPYGTAVIYSDTEEMFVNVGDDVSGFLGITKYDPPIPAHMAGEVFNAESAGATPVKYDIESYENYPDILQDGERVVITEKLHGTFTGMAVIPNFEHAETFESISGLKNVIVYSKGLGAGGKCFKDVPNNANNVYVRAYKSLTDQNRAMFNTLTNTYGGLHVLGETFGRGVQDLHYGQTTPIFRVFDVYLGQYPLGRYANDDELTEIVSNLGLTRVPLIARMHYDLDYVIEVRDGKDSISNSNVREGVVVRPVVERRDAIIGRVQLKFVSPNYKLRKGQVTENQ
jgi:RNA ligase (TIGR02306 family)